ncbi:MAG: hypothetical protein J6S67_25360 [Methanobrevibacter sp.]|nr:hypothetical protein [Methanobrevibacter sp.]
MAEKEERILIDVINPGINCVYRLDNDPKGQSLCKHNGNMEPVTAKECRHCDEGVTRQEVIEIIAFANCGGICENCSDSPKGGPDCVRWLKDCGKWEKAETALNALLEGK